MDSDDRFVRSSNGWSLTPDAPVPGASSELEDLPDSERPPVVEPISRFVVIDIESTGLDPLRDELLEIAAVRFEDWNPIESFSTWVRAKEIPTAVTALTGITLNDLRGAPSPESAVAQLVEFVDDSILLGQNIGYDLSVLSRFEPQLGELTRLDLLEIAHIVFPLAVGRSLKDLAGLVGVEVNEAHRAEADCLTTVEVARRLVEILNRPDPVHDTVRRIIHDGRHPWSGLLAAPGDTRSFLQTNPVWLNKPGAKPGYAPSALAVFEPEGLLAQHVPNAEHRPAQREMAEEVESAFQGNARLLIEAPTGTGKTFAYLLPAIRQASATDRPVIVSTHTKALQTQLEGDFERLVELGLVEGVLAVLKGRESYLCTRDLLAGSEDDLSSDAAIELATLMMAWGQSEEGEIGEVTDFWLTSQHAAAAEVRRSVTLNPSTCERRSCEFYDRCPYYSARRAADSANVVVVNHALLITNLANAESAPDEPLSLGGLVIDEAHNLSDAATSVLTKELNPVIVSAWLSRLLDNERSSGLLRNIGRAFGLSVKEHQSLAVCHDSVRRARKAVADLNERMATYLSEFVGRPEPGGYPITHRFRAGIDDSRFLFLEAREGLFTVAQLLIRLKEALRTLVSEVEGLEPRRGFNGKALKTRLLAESARANELAELSFALLKLDNDENVRYVTWQQDSDSASGITLTIAPIDVSPSLSRVYAKSPATVATSATLTVGGTFDYMQGQLAAQDFTTSMLPNTFDYANQASLILTRHLPAPRVDREIEFVRAVADTAMASIGTAGGGTLGLFTSKRRVKAAFEITEPGVRSQGLDLRAQLPGTSTRELAAWFKASTDGSLFGLRSFWEGFDNPGESLRLVLIEKIPFPSPSDPLIAARSERLEAQGRDPFFELSVPVAALVFKQGFGRLIRTRSDLGAVVVLDRRLRAAMSYQAEFIDSLPEGLPVEFPLDESNYLETLARSLGREPRLDLARGVGPIRSVADLSRTTVSDADDPEEVKRAFAGVKDLFGVGEFRPGQEELIRAIVVNRRDAVGLLPTGAGKSMIYQAAAMCLDGVGLVVSPLVALMRDQVDGLRSDLGFTWAHALYGGQSGSERDEVLDSVREGGCRLLYLSPERLRDPTVIRALGRKKLTFVAVDEAHCVSVWGHDFRPDFLTIMPALRAIPGVDEAPRLALTATAPEDVLADVIAQLELRKPLIERRSVDRPNLHFSVVKCRSNRERRSQLLRAVLAHHGSPGLVYCQTRRRAEAAAAMLRSQGIFARHYHAGMPPEQREAVELLFMTEQVQVVCATNAFGLGIDKPNIMFVVHDGLPLSLDAYFQEAGRAARDPGLEGNAVLLWTRSDQSSLERLVQGSLPTLEDVEKIASHIGSLPRPQVTIQGLASAVGLDEVSVRVGVHLLERAGALAQGPDVGSKALLSVPTTLDRIRARFGESTADSVQEVLADLSLRPPTRTVIDLLAPDSHDPHDIEESLLALAEQEVLGYRVIERAMSLTAATVEWNRQSMSRQIRRLRDASFERLETIVAYARGTGCRRGAILKHFGEETGETCGKCDSCAGLPDLLISVDPIRYQDAQAVTEVVAGAVIGMVREASRVNSRPGIGSFVKALKGVSQYGAYAVPTVLQRSRHFGALGYMSESEIREAIDQLGAEGRVIYVERERRAGGTYVGLDVRA